MTPPAFHRRPPRALSGLLLGAALAAQAAVGEPGAVTTPGAQRGLSTTAPLKLQKTVIDSGTAAGLPLPAGTYTPVGTVLKLNCAVAAGCVIAATLELQITQVGNNAPALCFFLDGQKVTCPYVDKLSASTGFRLLNHHSSAAVPFGEHLVEMRVYTEALAAASYYQAEYRLFK